MKKKIIDLVIHCLPQSIIHNIEKPLRDQLKGKNTFYSQNGEDIVVSRLLKGKTRGFFVDVGAHHPTRFSNTFAMYQRGWRGINIDATPGSMKAFNEKRPSDINLEFGVSDEEGSLTFYMFNEPALNTFSREEALKKDALPSYKITGTASVPTLPLAKILERYLPSNTSIDYLNIDVEGLDIQVLRSNDWTRCQPEVISVESNFSGGPVSDSELYVFLGSRGYHLVSVIYNTLIFAKHGSGTNSVIRI